MRKVLEIRKRAYNYINKTIKIISYIISSTLLANEINICNSLTLEDVLVGKMTMIYVSLSEIHFSTISVVPLISVLEI